MKRKSKKKKLKTIFLIISLLVIFLAGFFIYSYAGSADESIFVHENDYLDLKNNVITYNYLDKSDGKTYKEEYTISNDWLPSMTIRTEGLDIGTNTTIYGPYTWLPAGDYRVNFNLTPEGWQVLQYWDVGVNKSQATSGTKKAKNDASGSIDYNNCSLLNGTTISSIVCGGNNTGGNLQYTIHTNGNSADYELRTFYTAGFDAGEPNKSMELKQRLLSSIYIQSENANTISFDANGGVAYDTESKTNKSTGKLTDTYWGATRGNVSVPTRAGYVFDGWYGYSQASNTTNNRNGLKFDTKSEVIQIWDKDGKPVGNTTEAAYYGYTVYAHWTPAKYTLGFNADGGTLPSDGNMGVNQDCHLSEDKTNGGVPVTYNEGWYNDMSRDIPYREGYTFNGWYKPYWNDNGTLNHLEQIYNNEGRAVESSIWHWDNNTGWHYIYASNETLWAGWTKNDYSLDLNIVYGGKKLCSTEEILPYIDGFDVYIDGNLVAENVPDYCGKVPYSSAYEFKNFRMKPGYVFADTGDLKGTIGAGDKEVCAYVYNDYALAYYDGNGATKGKDWYIGYDVREAYEKYNGNAYAMENKFLKNNCSFKNYKTEYNTYRNVGDSINPKDNSLAKAVIRSAYNNNFVVDTSNGNVSGSNIHLWSEFDGDNQCWSFLPSGDGYWFIVNTAYGKFLDLTDGNTTDLANVQLCNLNWAYTQQWKITAAGNGYYYIASRCNENYRLDAQGGSQNSNAGQNVCVYHAIDYDGQKWKIDFLNREDYFQVQWTGSGDATGLTASRLIEYYGNGDNNNSRLFESYNATSNSIVRKNTFIKTGYSFKNYNTASNGSGSTYNETNVIPKTDCQGITLIRNHTNYDYAIKQTSSNSTLYTNYADYELNQWWSFVKAKDINAYYIINQATGQALSSSNNVVKAVSWNTQDNNQLWDLELICEHEYQISVHNRNEYLTMRDDNYIYTISKAEDTDEDYDYQLWNLDGISTSLYVQWEANKYILYFDYNKPTNAVNPVTDITMLNKTITYDSPYGVLPTPSLLTWKFEGWYTAKTGGTPITKDSIVKVTSNQTLYAHWTPLNVNYVINYWTEKLYKDGTNDYADYTKLDSDNYSKYYSVTKTALSDSEIEIIADNQLSSNQKIYLKGFTLQNMVVDGVKNKELSAVVHINGNGQTVVDFYYKRNIYNVPDNPSDPDNNNENTIITPGNGINSITKNKKSYKYEEVVTLTANLKEGYHWHINDDCETVKENLYPTGWIDEPDKAIEKFLTGYDRSKQTIKFYMPAHNVKVTANATNNSYLVNFNKNTPVGRINSITKDISSASNNIEGNVSSKYYIYNHNGQTLPDEVYTLTGWKFIGYSLDNNANSDEENTIQWGYAKDSWNSDLSHLTTKNLDVLTLYSKWDANTYEVELYPNKPAKSTEDLIKETPAGYTDNQEYFSKTFTYDATNNLPLDNVYYIKGWSCHPYKYTLNDENKTIDYSDSKTNKVWNITTTDKDVIELYMQWTENKYNVLFDTEGGTKVNDIKSSLYEGVEGYYMPEASHRPGFTFVSWNTNVNEPKEGENYLAKEQFKKLVSEDEGQIVFHAIWKQKKVVTLNAKSNVLNQNETRDTAEIIDKQWYDYEQSGQKQVLQEWNVDKDTIEQVK